MNSAAGWACNAPLVRTIANNPVFMALLLTAIAAVIVLAMFRGAFKQKGGTKRVLQALVYFTLAATIVLFVHHRAVEGCVEASARQKEVRSVFSSIQLSREHGGTDAFPVVPGHTPEDEVLALGPTEPRGVQGAAEPAWARARVDESRYAPQRTHAYGAAERQDNVAYAPLEIPDVRLRWTGR